MDLIIRNIPAEIWETLDKKAKASGRTIEAEAKALLEDALSQPAIIELDDLQTMVAQLYGNKPPRNEVEERITDRRREAQA